MKTKNKYIIIFALLILLVLIRFFEHRFFNDGLFDFFAYDYQNQPVPNIDIFKTLWIDSLRFWINSVLSIAILYVFFKQEELLPFLLFVFGLIFMLDLVWFGYSLKYYQTGKYLQLFYARRILIQPLLLFILFPALLYQKHMNKQ